MKKTRDNCVFHCECLSLAISSLPLNLKWGMGCRSGYMWHAHIQMYARAWIYACMHVWVYVYVCVSTQLLWVSFLQYQVNFLISWNTCFQDVIELLEKRVKSRFSHRQIYLFDNMTLDDYTSQCLAYLSLDDSFPDQHFALRWNTNVKVSCYRSNEPCSTSFCVSP